MTDLRSALERWADDFPPDNYGDNPPAFGAQAMLALVWPVLDACETLAAEDDLPIEIAHELTSLRETLKLEGAE